MDETNPPSRASFRGHPVHAMLVSFPIVCFTGALVTDITYWRTANMQWANFSAWLLTAGVLIGLLAAVAGLVDFLGSGRVRALRPAWYHAAGNALALLLSVWNAFVHSRDAYTSVVPTGLTLSALVVLILLVTSWWGGSLVFRHRGGVAD